MKDLPLGRTHDDDDDDDDDDNNENGTINMAILKFNKPESQVPCRHPSGPYGNQYKHMEVMDTAKAKLHRSMSVSNFVSNRIANI